MAYKGGLRPMNLRHHQANDRNYPFSVGCITRPHKHY